MRMISCVSPVTGGELRVLGLDPATDGSEIRGRLGAVPQEDTLDLELTVRENLLIYGRYFGLARSVIRERADELMSFVQLTDRSGDRVDELSGGMKRRLTIARALINRPELVLLDEPTTGLDPQARHLVWERLYQLKRQGVTLVLTTHYMDEAEQLCDRLVIMDGGHIVAEGSPRQLIDRHSTREVVELRFDVDDDRAKAQLVVETSDMPHESLADRILVYTDDGEAEVEQLARAGVHPRVRARAARLARGRVPAPHRPHAGGVDAHAPRLPGRRAPGPHLPEVLARVRGRVRAQPDPVPRPRSGSASAGS